MSNYIHTPGLVNVDDHSSTSATFVIEPLHSGYGMTLGNSLRRVLLSSIPARQLPLSRSKVRTHEFTVSQVLKKMSSTSCSTSKAYVSVSTATSLRICVLVKKGKGAVTAKDIQTNADVEIVNPSTSSPQSTIAKAKFVVDMTVEVGRGYRTIEEGAARKASDMIALDAIFSPVLRVRYKS